MNRPRAMIGPSMRVLLVEDEPHAAQVLAKGLREQTYAVDVAADGDSAVFQVATTDYDAVILDVMLPVRDGFAVCRTIRDSGCAVPILMVTARDAVESRIQGLDSGADDYLVKPFAFPELLARIRALLRRGRPDQVLRLQQDDLTMDLVTRKVMRAGRALELTVKEFEMLEYLLRHVGHVVSREMLARDVWRVTARATPLDNVIDVTVTRLRRKIDDPFETKLLHTVRGVGFVLRRERT
jgi:DNA-binding response OmpR family regulator